MAWLPVAIITLVGAAVRFATLDVQSYWYDEALTVFVVVQDFGPMVEGALETQAQPPPYFILAWLWSQAFGIGEVGLRSLSALLGTLTIPVAAAAAHVVAGRRAALAVALLTALSPPLIWYSQEARAYALVTFLCALAVLFFVRSLERPARRDLVLWVVTSILAVASHYFALFLLLPQAAWLLWRSPDRRAVVPYVGAAAVGLLAVVPMLLYQREHGGAEWIEGVPMWPRVRDAAAFFAGGPEVPHVYAGLRPLLIVTTLVVFAFAVAAALRAVREPVRSRFVAVLVAGVVVLALPLAAAVVGFDFVLDRNLLPAWIPLVIAFGVGLTSSGLRRIGPAIVGLTCLWFAIVAVLVPQRENLQRDDWRRAAQVIGAIEADHVVEPAPGWFALPLSLYTDLRQMLRPRPVSKVVTVRYLAFVPWNDPPEAIPPGPPFRETRRYGIENMEIVEYVSPRPVVLRPTQLSGTGYNTAYPLAVPAP